MYVTAFYIVFAVLKLRNEDFFEFILVGLIPWKWFVTSVMHGGNSIVKNSGLIRQVYLPKVMFPTVSVAGNTVKFFAVFILLLIVISIRGYSPALSWVTLPLIVLVQLLLVMGLTWCASSLMPFFPDLKSIVGNLMMFLFFVSGIIFDVRQAPENMQTYINANPLVRLITAYRDVLLNHSFPNFGDLLYVAAFGLVCLTFGFWILYRNDRIYPKVII